MNDSAKPHRHRAWSAAIFGLVFVAACAVGYVVVRDAVNKTVEIHALSVAEVVAAQAMTARSVYSAQIVEKLRRDGYGSNVDAHELPGFVPIPAQFLKLIGTNADADAALYRFRPVSKWNLEPEQGLSDDFLRWAWPQLEQQDRPNPEGPIEWAPVWRFESQQDKGRVLRYLRADPAAQMACVSCHNSYEMRPAVQAMRTAAGISTGKQWQQHQLLGALAITIPLDNVEYVAAHQIRETAVLIFGILIASFAAIAWFSFRLARRDAALRDTVSQLQTSEQQARHANALLLAKQGVERAFAELSTYLQAIDQHALVAVTDPNGRILQANDKFCRTSGYGASQLVGSEHRIVKSGVHPDSFFTDLWATIASGEIWRGEICNRTADGSLYWVDSAIVPLKDDAGRIARYISISIDISERKRAEQRMMFMATHDVLTGLANRNLLQDRISQAIAHNRRSNRQAAVLFIDLDRFKTINDSLGHDVGDLLLIEVSRRLVSVVREEDTVARQGGDEFIVLLASLDEGRCAAQVADKLLQAVAEPYLIKGKELHVSASIGIALFPDDGQSVDVLLKHSDIAMYHAKEKGRNISQFFAAEMNVQAAERHEIGSELRQALARGELRLHYQPIVEMRSGAVARMEVLLRWEHPRWGQVSPLKFIPLAEDNGLIIPISEWVLRTACDQLRAWREAGFAVPRLSINLSARQFHQQDLLESVAAILAETGVDAAQIELEITEGMLMENTEQAVERLRALNDMGFEIAVDDFGTGYSSLNYLKRFPIDTLKIDRSFVMDIASDPDDAAIVTAIIALAHSLEMRVVAEGVEDEAQLAFLRAQGCDYFQGFYFSRPLPAADAEHVLRRC
ncbi:MAG TPA: EAL domain-containing protein [Noviherbaspirillum sp.]|nr:EAL domain-containing protein [Noviherbaspirillum sp.]